MALRPKNWNKFQHYKNRRPSWIKLHRELLDKEEFYALKGDDAKYLFMIWLIASEEHGELPPIKQLAFRLRLTVQKCEQLVSRLDEWLEDGPCVVLADKHDPASNPLAEDAKCATTEEEEEKEVEVEVEVKKRPAGPPRPKAASFAIPAWILPETWQAFEETRRKIRAPMTDRARQNIITELKRLEAAGHHPDAVLNQSITRAWRGVFAIHEENNGGKRNGSNLGESNGERAMRVLAESLAADQARTDAVRGLPAGEDRPISFGALLGKIGAGAG